MVGKDLIMATLLGSGGGSSGSGGVRMTTGAFIPAENVIVTSPNFLEVTHGLGEVPDLIIFEQDGFSVSSGASAQFVSMELRKTDNGIYAKKVIYYTKNSTGSVLPSHENYPTEEVFFVGNIGSTSALIMYGGIEYIWYAFKWEE